MAGDHVTAADALEVAQRAINRTIQLEDQQEEIDELRERIVATELRLSEQDDKRDYRDYTIDEKVGMVREHLFDKARDKPHRMAKVDYNGVVYEVFDGEPGNSHPYKLMRLAADCAGFEYDESVRPAVLRCEADVAIAESRAFSPEDKTRSGGAV